MHAYEVRAGVFDQILDAGLDHLVRHRLQGEHVLERVGLVLVDPAALDANGVHQERKEIFSGLNLVVAGFPGKETKDGLTVQTPR